VTQRVAALLLLLLPGIAAAVDPNAVVGGRACAALSARVGAFPGGGPVFLRSYDAESGKGEPSEPALRTAAFTYDNAVATIALLACGESSAALRVGEALRCAALASPRLRNAYRAGAVDDDKPLPNGWWDASASRWAEDAYQDGSATGNIAWAALALLALHDTTHDARWSAAAAQLGRQALSIASDASADGFFGGVEGFDAAPVRLRWKSTEHNIDLVAVFERLDRARQPGEWHAAAASARRFVAAQWEPEQGRFWTGTLPDGTTNRATSALDVQLWSQLLRDAPHEWQRAVVYAEREHGVDGGFDFDADRDGTWLEGTAQAALVYRVLERERSAQPLLATIAANFSDGGLVYATREPRVSTGLAANAKSRSADFFYFRRPHLAATAWAALAARNRNPFAEWSP
jgi:hypothetical protein